MMKCDQNIVLAQDERRHASALHYFGTERELDYASAINSHSAGGEPAPSSKLTAAGASSKLHPLHPPHLLSWRREGCRTSRWRLDHGYGGARGPGTAPRRRLIGADPASGGPGLRPLGAPSKVGAGSRVRRGLARRRPGGPRGGATAASALGSKTRRRLIGADPASGGPGRARSVLPPRSGPEPRQAGARAEEAGGVCAVEQRRPPHLASFASARVRDWADAGGASAAARPLPHRRRIRSPPARRAAAPPIPSCGRRDHLGEEQPPAKAPAKFAQRSCGGAGHRRADEWRRSTVRGCQRLRRGSNRWIWWIPVPLAGFVPPPVGFVKSTRKLPAPSRSVGAGLGGLELLFPAGY